MLCIEDGLKVVPQILAFLQLIKHFTDNFDPVLPVADFPMKILALRNNGHLFHLFPMNIDQLLDLLVVHNSVGVGADLKLEGELMP